MNLSLVDTIVLALLGGAFALGMVRMWRGPSNADRIVATDTLSVIATAAIAFFSVILNSALYLDVALIYGVLAFVGVVALARVIDGGRT